MSAPPSNNRQRFVSSINIPVNQPKEPQTQSNMPQPSAPPQPQERIIPIQVEGRDEPIIPKKASTSTSQPQAPPQPQPYTDKFFTQKSPNFSQYFNRDPNFHNDWFPKKHPQPQTSFSQNQRGKSPQPQQKQETPQQPTNAPPQAEPPQKPVNSRPDPIDQIKSIQKDVSELMSEVEKFSGQPKDKKYLYLDEMLTRNLIKLDNIDTQGQENIRLARKEAIKCIQKCISILESKANSNAEAVNKETTSEEKKEMETESTEDKCETAAENTEKSVEKMEVETDKTEIVSEEKMETEPNKENQQNEAAAQENMEQNKMEQQQTESNTPKEATPEVEVKEKKQD